MEEQNVFTFRAVHLPTFAEKMDALAKTASKLAVPPMTYEVIDRWTETEQMTMPSFDGMFEDRDWHGNKLPTYEVKYVKVRVDGTSPRLPGGWFFVGAIEHTEAGNMIHGDDESLSAYRTAPADCEHCGFKRNRRKTVIVRSEETNETKQIGSACLKDFLGYHGSADRIVSMLEALRDAASEDREDCGYYSAEHGADRLVFLSAVAACVRTHGWKSKQSANEYGGIATADLVRYFLGITRLGKHDDDIRALLAEVEMTDADETEARDIIGWAQAIDAQTTNNYLGNVRVALASDYIAVRHFGIAASAVSARKSEEEKAREKAEREGKRAASVHVGTVGKRETFSVSVSFVRAIESDYGTKYLVEMTDADGNILKTFNSGDFGRRAEKGDAYVIKATVKEHTEWQGTAQTMLARVAIIEA